MSGETWNLTRTRSKTLRGGSKKTGGGSKALRVIEIAKDIVRSPYEGIGKPEPLKHDLAGCWSRRIDQEHRIVYQVFPEKIRILACRFHY
jgi:toxin YoeB